MDILIDYFSPAVFATIVSFFLGLFVISRNYRYHLNALFGLLGFFFSCWFFHFYLIRTGSEPSFVLYSLLLSAIVSYIILQILHYLSDFKTKSEHLIPENFLFLPHWFKASLSIQLVFLILSGFVYIFSILLLPGQFLVLAAESIIISLSFLFLLENSFIALFSIFRILAKVKSLKQKTLEKSITLFFAVFWTYFSLGCLVLASKILAAWYQNEPRIPDKDLLLAASRYLNNSNLVPLLIVSALGLIVILGLVATYRYFFGYKIIITQLIAALIIVFNLISILNSGSVEEIVLRTILIVVLGFLSQLLVKSVTGEIEKRKKIQDTTQEIYEANKSLHRLDRAKSEFIAGASHQLRSPLSVIKGIGSMILDGSYGKLTPSVKDAMEKVYISNERLIGLIEDLLDVSHLEEGKVDFNFAQINLNDIAQKAVDGLSLQAQNKKLFLKFSPWKKSKLCPWVDEQKVTEAVSNLVDNAIKYTRRGGVRIEVKKAGNTAIISVKDTGIGLKKEEIGHLFQKFVRAGRGNKISTVGTGLGLYVVRKMIEAHKGRIWAESAGEGRGSAFIVELPLNLKTPPDKKFIQQIVMEKKTA